MLLLKSLDLAQRSVCFLALTGDRLRVRDEFGRMAELSAGLGFRDLVLHFATSGGASTQIEAYFGPEAGNGGSTCLGPDPLPAMQGRGAVATLPRLSLRGEMVGDIPCYELELEACGGSRPLLDAGLVLMLATWGHEDRSILELRTALFELGAHYLDHSDEIRAKAAGPSADQIRLTLRFNGDQVSGQLEDNGPAFDPSSSPRVHLKSESPALTREAGWFCRLLDEYEHDHGSSGNRIGFSKRVGQ